MDKQIVTHLYYGLLLAKKGAGNKLTNPTTWMVCKGFVPSEKANLKMAPFM